MTRAELEKRIVSSADALVKAALREIDRMMREGHSPEEILDALKTLRLPSAEATKLKRSLDKAFDEILTARGSVIGELIDADILFVKSAAQISFPKLQKDLIKGLLPTVQRAIASEAGPTVLRHQLRQLKVSQPKTLALTSLAQFDNELTFATAEVTLTNKFLYSGPVGPETRPFCREHAGKIYTLAEIEKMDNGQGISVRSSCGGYNCRHRWLAAQDKK